MTPHRAPPLLVLALIVSSLAACGGASSDGGATGPGGRSNQSATTVATPATATIARGALASTTIVYSTTGGLVLGGGGGINKQYAGITVNQTSTSGSGASITEVYSIGADATVPSGTHNVTFSKPLSGWTGTGPSSASTQVTFRLTVAP